MKILLIGAGGRMGQEIERLASASKADRIVARETKTQEKVDVLIDFSSPQGAVRAAKWCAKNRIPFVSGTTGLSQTQMKALRAASRRTAVLWSPNMSLGILAMRQALGALTKLKGWEFQIEEAHHSAKKDRPSGTAKLIQGDLAAQLKRRIPEPASIRGGSIAGVHTVWAMGAGEWITVTHVAQSREIFAHGALRAARWILNRRPGFYDFSEVLAE